MFNPWESGAVEEWFERFNARLRRLPAEERSQMQLEVRQHLEALAAANEERGGSPQEAWERAVEQFGDPAKIGERLLCEYQESRSGPYSGLIAVGFGIGLHLLRFGLYWLWILMPTLSLHYQSSIWYSPPLNTLLAYAFPLLIPFIIGRIYPYQAIRGAFYGLLFYHFVIFCVFLSFLVRYYLESHFGLQSPPEFLYGRWIGSALVMLFLNSAVAYLVSVTKRGWYRPSLADFKLTLPRFRRQTSR